MAVQIQLRRDTAANWTAADPVLAQGELGIETDTRYAKLGDGITNWVSLPYWPSAGIQVVTTLVRISMIPTAILGMVVYDSDLLTLYVFDGTAWGQV